jgi:hypothetical protein
MYHLANGYFGKGIFHHKPGLKMLPHQFVGDYNIDTIRDPIQRYATPQEYEIYIVNQDDFLRYSQRISCNIQTNGFVWVENLLSRATTSIHESQYTNSSNQPNMTLDINVDTLIGEHFWWDTTANSYSGGVSTDPFFRVTGSTVRDGTAEKNLEQAYPALITYAQSQRRSPLTVQMLHNTQSYSGHAKWKRNLRDFCIRTAYFPETLYIRFNNLALNPKTMTAIGENVIDDGGGDQPQLLVAPGFDPNDIPNADETNHIKYSMLEIDIIPMNPDIFPTSLPIMWSNQAFQFFYGKASGNEATAISRLQGSILDYGYEAMVSGQDYFDNTNSADTNYPISLATDNEYSKSFRENSDRLISKYSEWEFPSHLSELPTGSLRDSIIAFGFREPAGHRVIVTNINCVEDPGNQPDPFDECVVCDSGTTPAQYELTLSGMADCATHCSNCSTMDGTYVITRNPRWVESDCTWEGDADLTTSLPNYNDGVTSVNTEYLSFTLQAYKFGDSVYFDLRIYQHQNDNFGNAHSVHFYRSSTVATTVDCDFTSHSLSYVSSQNLGSSLGGGPYYCDATSSTVTISAV